MLRVPNKPFLLIVIMLIVAMLNVIMLNVIMLNVAMLNVIMLNVVAPVKMARKTKTEKNNLAFSRSTVGRTVDQLTRV